MKKYVALWHIGDVTRGEIITLSDQEAERLLKLGAVKPAGNGGGSGRTDAPGPGELKTPHEAEPETVQVNPDSETEPEPEDDLPVLEISGEMVGEAEPEPPKKKGRGKRS